MALGLGRCVSDCPELSDQMMPKSGGHRLGNYVFPQHVMEQYTSFPDFLCI